MSYYRMIARGNAGDLARAAARRAGRAIRNRLVQPDAAPDIARLSVAFGVEDLGGLADRIFDVRPNVVADPKSVRAALDRVEGARERALARAEDAAARRFRVFGTEVCFPEGTPIDWGLDTGCGASYPLLPATDPALLKRPGMDPKYPWVIGRLDQLIALGQGFIAASSQAQQDRFAQAYVAQVEDFLTTQPVGMGVHWTCPMEVALRAANLAVSLLMFDGAAPVRDSGFLIRVLEGLCAHTLFVEQHLENQGAVPNNHLVSNYVGLFVVSALFPELPHAPRHAALALAGLTEEMDRQVLPDGYSFEGSVPYHRLSVELFTLALLAARRHGYRLGEAFTQRLGAMYRVSAIYCSEHGLAPQVGDNDSGRALPFSDRASLDHGYLPALGAALFHDGALRLEGAACPDEAIWTLGEEGLSAFEALAPSRPAAVFSSPVGGLHLLRAGEAVLTVCAGLKGQRGVGGHNHHDQLSYELHVHGEPVIVDPGTAQYTRDPAQRNAFRSTAEHNTLQVDGRELGPMDPKRLFALPDASPAQVEALVPGETFARLEVSTRAFAPVSVRRSFFLDADVRALCVVDRLEGEGEHEVVSRLHLKDGEVSLQPVTEALLRRAGKLPFAPRAFEDQAVVIGPPQAPRAVVLVEAGVEVRLDEDTYSPGYGEVCEAKAVTLSLRRALPMRAAVVVLFG